MGGGGWEKEEKMAADDGPDWEHGGNDDEWCNNVTLDSQTCTYDLIMGCNLLGFSVFEADIG